MILPSFNNAKTYLGKSLIFFFKVLSGTNQTIFWNNFLVEHNINLEKKIQESFRIVLQLDFKSISMS